MKYHQRGRVHHKARIPHTQPGLSLRRGWCPLSLERSPCRKPSHPPSSRSSWHNQTFLSTGRFSSGSAGFSKPWGEKAQAPLTDVVIWSFVGTPERADLVSLQCILWVREHDETVTQQSSYLHRVDGCLRCRSSQRAGHEPLVRLDLLSLRRQQLLILQKTLKLQKKKCLVSICMASNI